MNEVLGDTTALLARFAAARDELLKDPHVAPERIGAIGYCFGGAVVLAEAEHGAGLDAVVSFHGAILPAKVDSGTVKARVLVLTGADDPMVPGKAVEGFRQMMTKAGANFRIVSYPGARHGFTNPFADSAGMPQLAYNAVAAQKSWDEMPALFREVSMVGRLRPPPSSSTGPGGVHLHRRAVTERSRVHDRGYAPRHRRRVVRRHRGGKPRRLHLALPPGGRQVDRPRHRRHR